MVLGCIGLAESFSYGTLGVLNSVSYMLVFDNKIHESNSQVILSDDSNANRFLIFFMTLAGYGLVSIPITWFVSDRRKEEERSNTQSSHE